MTMKKYLVVIALLSITISLSAQSFAEMPSSSFGSTSSMMGSGSSYASDPSLNAYGMAEAPTYAPNRGRTAGVVTPSDDPADDYNQPIGDAVPFLLLLAGGYAAFAALRRRKAVG